MMIPVYLYTTGVLVNLCKCTSVLFYLQTKHFVNMFTYVLENLFLGHLKLCTYVPLYLCTFILVYLRICEICACVHLYFCTCVLLAYVLLNLCHCVPVYL